MQSELERFSLHNAQLLEDIEQISAAASHELKDQLRGALMYCEQLRHHCDEEGMAALSHVEAAIHTIIDNVFVLRNYAYLTQNTEHPQWIVFEDVMSKVEARLAGDFSARNGKLSWPRGGKHTLYARPSQLETLLTHLVDNGLKFNNSPHPMVDIGFQEKDGSWACSVTDNGGGMESEFGQLVFGLFKRADPQNRVKGRGAGLAYAKKIVENHGGKVWMETAPEMGCKVSFTFANQSPDNARDVQPVAALRPA